ncbi:hypothetical protein CSKR_100177 [Clonorchis sinensis]|uniref:Uncharacterized protein n=1 Tax=Clonorchis sinensis TaxID=79923 RepID=A0A419PPS6_CLOSI|nr:hypothetical protein CSKR_100177 [Clonorchis sinensis]
MPFRCLTAMPPKRSTRAGILPGCPSLDRASLDTQKSGSNHVSSERSWFEPDFCVSRLALSRLGQPGSIPALVLLFGGMAVRHRKGATETVFRFFTSLAFHRSAVTLFWCLAAVPTEGSTRAEIMSCYPGLDRISRDAEVGFEPRIIGSSSVRGRDGLVVKARIYLPEGPRLGQAGSIPALVLPSGGIAARHRKGVIVGRSQRPVCSG